MRSTERLGNATEIAGKQHGLIRTAQLRELGFTARQVASLRSDGVIERLIRGLYRLPGTDSPIQRIAAVLMRHDGSVASHRSALYLHGLEPFLPPHPEFTVVGRTATGRTTLGVLHRSPIPVEDRVRVHGLPTTTVARSVVDASQCLTAARITDLVNVVVGRHLVVPSELEETAGRVEAASGRIGHALLREVLAPWNDEIAPDSPAEAAALRRIVAAGLPRPVTQYTICDESGRFVARVDMAWPAQRVVREYDSDRFHGPERTEADEVRLQAIERAGWKVGVVNRHDLRPGSTTWLQRLRSDLVSHAMERSA